MNRIRCKWQFLILVAAVVAAGLFCLRPTPYWEVRATVCVRGEAAGTVPELLESTFFSRHLREISDFDGQISASGIPGTQLVEITLRDNSKTHAFAGMEATQNQLPAVMGYFSEDFSMEILLEPQLREYTTRPDLVPWLLAGAAGLLLLLPAPKFREEWDLLDLLGRFARLTRRFRFVALAVCLLIALGFAVYRQVTYVPSFHAQAVVSIGDYTTETASQLPATLRGLLSSDLLAQHLEPDCRISAEGAARSNLFTLTATGPTTDAAQAALDTLITRWPELLPYAQNDLTMTIHQAAPAGQYPTNPFRLTTTLFQGLLGLAVWTVFAVAILLFRQNIDTAAPKAYNESQSDRRDSHEQIH